MNLRRVQRDLGELRGPVFGVATGVAIIVGLLAMIGIIFLDEPWYTLLLWPSSMLFMGLEAWIVIAAMRPLLRSRRRIWEFMAGWLVALPVMAVLKGIMMPDLPLLSGGGLLLVILGAAISVLPLLGVFDKVVEDHTNGGAPAPGAEGR